MAETTSIWTWVSLGVGTVALFASVIVPGSIYFYDKSAAGVMAEDKIQQMNGASVVKKEIEMKSNILNPAAILGGFKTAATAAASQLEETANNQIANATTAVTNVAQEAKANETINQELQPDIIRSTTTSEEILPLANHIDNESAPITSDIASAVAIPYTKKKPRSLKIVKSNLFLPEQVKAAQGLKARGLAARGLKARNLAARGLKARNLAAQTLAQGEAQYKIPMKVQQGVFVGGGRKTKNKRQRKPRTKKCLITKGDKMFMSFCI